METKRFKKINNIIAAVVLAVASWTYLATIEPTVSFWDCGEFIASSYKLEIGHAPGNPVFQIIARFFTLFGDKDHAAVLVNAMSALCSAVTIFFLYLTIVHLARRIYEKSGAYKADSGEIPMASAVALFGAGAVGSLAYCWSDTFWFSAVEGEVYAMSSLFTAVAIWAMLKWEERADEPHANRWLVFIALMMGLSIGVHLLNLLTIPAMGLIYYFRKYKVTRWGTLKAFVLSCLILAVILWGIIPYVPKIASYVDMLFVNTLGLPVNSGAAVFFLLLLGGCFFAVYRTYAKGKVLWNTVSLCIGAILIGYSVFAMVIIRSSENTPTNEYQPDNPFTLVRYLAREQYGSSPLLYGASYNAPVIDVKVPTYRNYMDGEYKELNQPAVPVFGSEGKMLFPRMHSASQPEYKTFYEMYTKGQGVGRYNTPTAGANLSFFLDYQIDFMYLRYFMWNFVGRQNDLQASVPGDIYKGNWESGIGFIDRLRLGDQSEGPDYIVNSRSKNHFYFLPLILGLVGIVYQLRRDKRNFLVTALLFFFTGIAIVLYLNQTPYQARERDYAYAGSFYVFSIWIGFAVMWLAGLLSKYLKGEKGACRAAAIASVLCLIVPVQMVSQTWDDHDRSGRYTCHDLAYNYLAGLDSNAMLVTHGDNDTFPLWYIQEVEGVRTDVRIINTSLLGTDWYIDQMKLRQYESEPIPFTLTKDQYYYGKNDFVPVLDIVKDPVDAKEIIDVFKDPAITVELTDGQRHNVIAGHSLLVPVSKENVIKYGIVDEKDYDKILDTIQLDIPQGVRNLSKTELLLLDLIAHYNWDRPLYLLQRGGDLKIGLKEYLQYEGFYWKFVPIKSKTGTEQGNIDQIKTTDDLYDRYMNIYRLESLAAPINIDYQNLLTFSSLMLVRESMANVAKALMLEGKKEKATALLDKMQSVTPVKNFPLNNSIISSTNDLAVIDAVNTYLLCGEKEKGLALGKAFEAETEDHILLFAKPLHGEIISWDNIRKNVYYLMLLADVYRAGGAVSEAAVLDRKADAYVVFFNKGMKSVQTQAERQHNADTPEEV